MFQIFQTVFFGFSLLNDVCGSNTVPWNMPEKRTKLQKWRDFLAASVIFPIGSVSAYVLKIPVHVVRCMNYAEAMC